MWGGEEQEQEVKEADELRKEAEEQEEADEWQEESDEQEEAEEWQEEAYQNSYWKVNHKGTMILVRDRKGIY